MDEPVQQGIEIVTKATEHDSHSRYAEAVYLYDLSVAFFSRGIQTNPSSRNILTQKINEYSARSLELRSQLPGYSNPHLAAPTSTPNVSQESNFAIGGTATTTIENELAKGTEFGNKALQAEEAKQWVAAVEYWEAVLHHFNLALTVDASEVTKTAIREKIMQYRERVNTIKDALKPKQMDPFVEAGIKEASLATEADACLRIPEAMTHYQAAIDNFKNAVQNPTNPEDLRNTLREKLGEYMVRIEQLRNIEKTGHKISGSIPMCLAKGQSQYVDPVKEKGFLSKLKDAVTPGQGRLSDKWMS